MLRADAFGVRRNPQGRPLGRGGTSLLAALGRDRAPRGGLWGAAGLLGVAFDVRRNSQGRPWGAIGLPGAGFGARWNSRGCIRGGLRWRNCVLETERVKSPPSRINFAEFGLRNGVYGGIQAHFGLMWRLYYGIYTVLAPSNRLVCTSNDAESAKYRLKISNTQFLHMKMPAEGAPAPRNAHNRWEVLHKSAENVHESRQRPRKPRQERQAAASGLIRALPVRTPMRVRPSAPGIRPTDSDPGQGARGQRFPRNSLLI